MAKLIPAQGALVDMFAHYTSPVTRITARTATGFVVEHWHYQEEYTGFDFTYAANEAPNGGTITGGVIRSEGLVLYTLTEAWASASDLATWFSVGYRDAVLMVILAGDDQITGGDGDDSLVGYAGDDLLLGGGGDDYLSDGAGNDVLDGGPGIDGAYFSVGMNAYRIARDGAVWVVTDRGTGETDTLRDVEKVSFYGVDLDLRLSNADAELATYNILRVQEANVALLVGNGDRNLAQGVADLISLARETTSVATLAYQFFTGKIPEQAGIDYLVSAAGPNGNNLNSAYYQSFNLENRYINFAVNLGKVGQGSATFAAKYGNLSLFDATREAYKTIFGGAPTDAKVHALIDTRVDYFASYGGDGATGIGTKAAMVGWLLGEAAKADVGMYAKASDAFLTDLADGASFAIDLVGVYGKAEYNYAG